MSKLPLEEINGAMYQPVQCGDSIEHCNQCVFNGLNKECQRAPCTIKERPDGLNIYYINPEVQP